MMQEASRGGSLRVNTRWLALPLSARGLLDELTKYVDEQDVVSLSLAEGADAVEVGSEISRLLCAHRGEMARVRRDTKALLERGFIEPESDGIRIWIDVPRTERVVDAPSLKPSTARMRLLRDRERASRGDVLNTSHVTLASVTSDARSDAGDASHVTRALSQDLNFNKTKILKERGSDGPGVRRCIPPDLPFSDEARAIAERAGVREAELTWQAFKAYYVEKQTQASDWLMIWNTWVVREVKYDRAHPTPNPPSPTQRVDLDAPWLRAASESS